MQIKRNRLAQKVSLWQIDSPVHKCNQTFLIPFTMKNLLQQPRKNFRVFLDVELKLWDGVLNHILR